MVEGSRLAEAPAAVEGSMWEEGNSNLDTVRSDQCGSLDFHLHRPSDRVTAGWRFPSATCQH